MKLRRFKHGKDRSIILHAYIRRQDGSVHVYWYPWEYAVNVVKRTFRTNPVWFETAGSTALTIAQHNTSKLQKDSAIHRLFK